MDLLCVGDLMLDVHAEAGALAEGGDVHGRVRVAPGGTSANAAVWGRWAGADVGVVGAVGDDIAGRLLTEALNDRRVDVSGVVRMAGASGTMLVVSADGERSMVADRGANARLGPDHLPVSLDATAVLISGYLLLQEPTTRTAIEAMERARTSLLAVEAGSWPLVEAFGSERFLASTERASIVLANAREARSLVGGEARDAASRLGERFRIAVVKCGADGAVVAEDRTVHRFTVDPIEGADPSGAGDAFDGVFLSLLARGADVAEAAERAGRAGRSVAAGSGHWPEPEGS